MTEEPREEQTFKRDLEFSQWVRHTLRKPSTGFVATDIDFFFQDYKNSKLMLIEVKTRGGDQRWSQKKQFQELDALVKKGAEFYGRDYWGLHIIKLSGRTPDDSSEIYLDDKLVTRKQLISFLNFEDKLNE